MSNTQIPRGLPQAPPQEGPPAGSIPRLEATDLASAPLQGVSFTLAPGESVSLSGASGAGKSRLLRALADLDPHTGQVMLDGKPQDAFDGPAWRRLVGLLPPESAWWSERVGEHFGAHEDLELELEPLGLTGAMLDWPVSRLSSGERQRLALVRLLANRPPVLLLDEPTANLDPGNTALAEALIDRYRRASGASVLWVSHDPAQVARVGERHLRLDAGRLREVAGA